MDILISSNLERLLYHVSGSSAKVAGWMADLAKTGMYTVDAETLARIQASFACGCADDTAGAAEINARFEQDNYLCDTHTAVAFCVAGSQLLEQLVGNVLSGNEAQRLTIGSQITLLAQGNHLFSQGLDLLGTGNGGFHTAVIQEIGDLLTEHRHTLIGSFTELTSSGHFCFLLVRILLRGGAQVSCFLRRPDADPSWPVC